MPITPPAGRECRDASQLGGEGRGASTRGEDALGTVSPGGSWPASSPESSSPGHLGPSAGRTQGGPGSTLGLLLPSTPGGGRGSPPPRLPALGPPLHAAHGATLPPGPSLCLGELGQALAFAQGGGSRAAQVPAPQLAFSGASPSSSLYPLSVPPHRLSPAQGAGMKARGPAPSGSCLRRETATPSCPRGQALAVSPQALPGQKTHLGGVGLGVLSLPEAPRVGFLRLPGQAQASGRRGGPWPLRVQS